MNNMLINFHNIVPHFGGSSGAFEELCCQNAHHVLGVPANSEFMRYRGSGGDGGVECVWRLESGKEWGWQVKYIFDLTKALPKAAESLATAISIHPQMERFTICFPFDLAGPTGKRSRAGVPAVSERERFDAWRAVQEQKAAEAGVDLKIFLETPATLLDALQSYDPDGGRLRFWFDASFLGEGWFENHLEEARNHAGPRYSAELRVDVPVAQALEALCLTDRWLAPFSQRVAELKKASMDWKKSVANSQEGGWATPFPDGLRFQGEAAADALSQYVSDLEAVARDHQFPVPTALRKMLSDMLLPMFREISAALARDIDKTHGAGRADSAQFRQFHAEYQVSFPAANLDQARDIVQRLQAEAETFASPVDAIAGKHEFVLTGDAGTGKTHAVCDAAYLRSQRRMRTVVLFGERFSGTAEPWNQIRQQLGLPEGVGREALLSALDAAGEGSGQPLLLCLDGLNETVPRPYWPNHLASLVTHLRRYPFVKLCITCRSTYLSQVLPEGTGLHLVEHEGFKGMEFDACRAFFAYYGLEPPMTPILQTEFANPLFLHLVCTAAREQGYGRLPAGWYGIYAAVSALLQAKNKTFAKQYSIMESYKVPERGLNSFIASARASDRSSLPFDEAAESIQSAVPAGVICGPLLDWLVVEGLLIVDAEINERTGRRDDHVRISFERLGDHLLAGKYLDNLSDDTIRAGFAAGGDLHFAVQDIDAVLQNRGLVEALAVQVPERFGIEIVSCIDPSGRLRNLLLETTVRSLLWRDPELLTETAREVLFETLAVPGLAYTSFDALIEICALPSPVDAFCLHTLLTSKPMPARDAFLCPYLHHSFEKKGPVEKLIRAGLEMELGTVSDDVSERWATALLWFCAAADRRVRDYATKALIRITEAKPALWKRLIVRFSSVDDEYVVERCLVAAYGALLRAQDLRAEEQVAAVAYEAVFRDSRRFQNASIRDCARSILELAEVHGVLPAGIGKSGYMPPYESDWPLSVPTQQDVASYKDSQEAFPKLYYSCTGDDFFIYTMSRLDKYDHALSKRDMGNWIYSHVLNMGYTPERFGNYDSVILHEHGGGRGKPVWAERIGKKYQWIALTRLTARLSDNVEARKDEWGPEPTGIPLVCPSGRDIDPSLLVKTTAKSSVKIAWWQPVQYDYGNSKRDGDEWIRDQGDIPDSCRMVEVFDPSGNSWLALEQSPQWRQKGQGDTDENDLVAEREIWMQVRSYLVAEEEYEDCWKWLGKQDFMGRWMPEGSSFEEGFVGEYPWATMFSLYPDSWSSHGGSGRGQPPCEMIPACHFLNSHDEYDAYQTESVSLRVPTREFFDADLNWDGEAGFKDKQGNHVFIDPSFGSAGPSALLVNPDFLADFLSRRRLRVVWTVLAQKLVLNDNSRARFHYSRAHSLEDGKLVSSLPIINVDRL